MPYPFSPPPIEVHCLTFWVYDVILGLQLEPLLRSPRAQPGLSDCWTVLHPGPRWFFPGRFSCPQTQGFSSEHGAFQCQVILTYNLELEIRACIWDRIGEVSVATVADSLLLYQISWLITRFSMHSLEKHTFKITSCIECICARHCVKNLTLILSFILAVGLEVYVGMVILILQVRKLRARVISNTSKVRKPIVCKAIPYLQALYYHFGSKKCSSVEDIHLYLLWTLTLKERKWFYSWGHSTWDIQSHGTLSFCWASRGYLGTDSNPRCVLQGVFSGLVRAPCCF